MTQYKQGRRGFLASSAALLAGTGGATSAVAQDSKARRIDAACS